MVGLLNRCFLLGIESKLNFFVPFKVISKLFNFGIGFIFGEAIFILFFLSIILVFIVLVFIVLLFIILLLIVLFVFVIISFFSSLKFSRVLNLIFASKISLLFNKGFLISLFRLFILYIFLLFFSIFY